MPAVHAVDKAAQLACPFAANPALGQKAARAFQKVHAQGPGLDLDRLHRLVAKPTLGGIDHPLKGQIIGGRDGQPEIGHRIADFLAFVKARPADHTIRQADGQKPVFKGTHLMGGTDKNGHLFQRARIAMPPAPLQPFHFLAHPARLFLTVPMADEADLFAVLLFGPQRLAQTPLIAGDHGAGGGQNMGGRAVILLQPHHNGARKILFKPQDIAHLGPAPAIDRLVIIAHAADVLMRLRQKPQPKVLADVGILVLVHQNIAEPALILFQHIGVFLKDHHAMQQKIAKIGGVQSAQTLLILLIKLGSTVVEGRSLGRGHAIRGQRAVFPAVDDPSQKPRGPTFFVDIGGGNQLFQQAQLVVSVQNREVRLQPHQFRMTAQNLH